MSLPAKIIKASEKKRETNDCTVKALAIAGEMSYERAHQVFRLQGRKWRKGVSTWTVERVLHHLGFKYEKLESWKGKTSKTLDLPRKDNYLAFTCNHALAVKFGLVKDWSHKRNNRITEVWRLIPTGTSEIMKKDD